MGDSSTTTTTTTTKNTTSSSSSLDRLVSARDSLRSSLALSRSLSSSISSTLPPSLHLRISSLLVTHRRALAFAAARGDATRAAILSLNADYLSASPSPSSSHLDSWTEDLNIVVGKLLREEHALCRDILGDLGDLPSRCFAEIASRSGVLGLLRYGFSAAASGPRDPIKLLKLLDVFRCLTGLRPEFNRFFGGRYCEEIRDGTRELVHVVVEGAAEIFLELLSQVELQRSSPPPADGGLPKLVTFTLGYCNRLLGDEYRPVLSLILVIRGSWRREKPREGAVQEEVLRVVDAVEQNGEAWAGFHGSNPALANLFKMNLHRHFSVDLAGTEVGELTGEDWAQEQERYAEYHAAMYLRESWRRLPALLGREGIGFLSGGRATAREIVKRCLKNFNDAFDEMYGKHARWVVPDEGMRERLRASAVQAVVPAYRSYVESYGPLVGMDGASAGRYVKYVPEALERMLGCLFVAKSSGKSTGFRAGRISNRNRSRSIPALG